MMNTLSEKEKAVQDHVIKAFDQSVAYAKEGMNKIKSEKGLKVGKYLALGSSALMLFLISAKPASAAGFKPTVMAGMDIFERIGAVLAEIYEAVRNIVVPIAAVIMLIAGILWMVSKNPQRVEDAKTWFIRAFVGIILIYGLGYVLNLAEYIGGEDAPDIDWGN